MGKSEGYVENYLRDEGKRRGFKCYKFTSPSNSGVPDRVVIGHGHTVFVELKAPGKKTRPLQEAVHREMRRYGAKVYVIDNRDDVDMLFDTLIENKT